MQFAHYTLILNITRTMAQISVARTRLWFLRAVSNQHLESSYVKGIYYQTGYAIYVPYRYSRQYQALLEMLNVYTLKWKHDTG